MKIKRTVPWKRTWLSCTGRATVPCASRTDRTMSAFVAAHVISKSKMISSSLVL